MVCASTAWWVQSQHCDCTVHESRLCHLPSILSHTPTLASRSRNCCGSWLAWGRDTSQRAGPALARSLACPVPLSPVDPRSQALHRATADRLLFVPPLDFWCSL